MKVQLRKFIDINGDGQIKYTKCALDAKGNCHVNKPIDQAEFDDSLAYYMDATPWEVSVLDDNGQSEELYEVLIT